MEAKGIKKTTPRYAHCSTRFKSVSRSGVQGPRKIPGQPKMVFIMSQQRPLTKKKQSDKSIGRLLHNRFAKIWSNPRHL